MIRALLIRGAVLAGLAALVPGGATAACRLALLLALDISSSVDAAEDALQRQGMAAALMAPEVAAAFLAVPGHPVALSVVEWSGQMQQDVTLDWVLIDDAATLSRVAARISASRRPYAEFSTAIGAMLTHADGHFRRGPRCDAQVLDISGDGVQNDGPTPEEAYASGALGFAIVNALAIITDDPTLDHAEDDDLMRHFQTRVIRGPGAFVIRADGFDDYQRALSAKLVRELSIQIGQAEAPALPRPGQ